VTSINQKPQLRLEQVSLVKSLGGALQATPILTDISFEVFQGEAIAIIGPSGAGKTSLLRLLNRLSEPTGGMIYLNNHHYSNIPAIQLRRQVMLVPQEPKLLGMTVRQALAYPLQLRGDSKSDIQQRLQYGMEQLHIPEDWLERTELQLSVGQRQLVAIARAFVTQPPVLLLDEPTSALDAGRANYILSVLRDLTQAGNTTVLMVNHQLDMAKLFAKRVLYLQDGRLMQDTLTTDINWEKLRDRLLQAETQAAEEWR
jgi:D-methionine transport system ATP-binding protein